ncbi:MAG: glycosyltransferase family 2 protein [Bacteroidota bacterium]
MAPDISIVIISWKMKDLLQTMLKSLVKYSQGLSYELIIIDNNSQDGTIELIEEDYPDSVLIKNKVNLGVALARNQGLKIAKGKYILILDADMELVENSVQKMLEFMDVNREIGLCGCKLLDTDHQLQLSCKNFPTIWALIARRMEFIGFVKNSKALRRHTMSDWDHSETREVDYVIGACQFYRKEVIEKIGFYDEHIFYGPEDLDFCLRTWRAGYKVVYFPHTKIIHHEQRITKKKLFSKISGKHFKGIYYIFRKYNFRLKR